MRVPADLRCLECGKKSLCCFKKSKPRNYGGGKWGIWLPVPK